MSDRKRPGRISWLDGWRGLACWLMVGYHLTFDLVMFGWVAPEFVEQWPVVLWQRFIAFSFILCAGWSATLTRSNARRGLIVSAAGLIVVAASYLVGAPIKFGVLQFLGLAMLLYAAAGKQLARIPEAVAPVLWLGLFILGWIGLSKLRVETEYLFWLGLRSRTFESFDYVPMVPYLFLFFLGSWLGEMAAKYRARLPFLEKTAPGILTWPGRRTLIIYMLHQPVLFGICAAVYILL